MDDANKMVQTIAGFLDIFVYISLVLFCSTFIKRPNRPQNTVSTLFYDTKRCKKI